MIDDAELQRSFASETRSRRRAPIDPEIKEQRQRLLRAFKRALQECDEESFIEALRREIGLPHGSPGLRRAVQVWRDYHGKP